MNRRQSSSSNSRYSYSGLASMTLRIAAYWFASGLRVWTTAREPMDHYRRAHVCRWRSCFPSSVIQGKRIRDHTLTVLLAGLELMMDYDTMLRRALGRRGALPHGHLLSAQVCQMRRGTVWGGSGSRPRTAAGRCLGTAQETFAGQGCSSAGRRACCRVWRLIHAVIQSSFQSRSVGPRPDRSPARGPAAARSTSTAAMPSSKVAHVALHRLRRFMRR